MGKKQNETTPLRHFASLGGTYLDVGVAGYVGLVTASVHGLYHTIGRLLTATAAIDIMPYGGSGVQVYYGIVTASVQIAGVGDILCKPVVAVGGHCVPVAVVDVSNGNIRVGAYIRLDIIVSGAYRNGFYCNPS